MFGVTPPLPSCMPLRRSRWRWLMVALLASTALPQWAMAAYSPHDYRRLVNRTSASGWMNEAAVVKAPHGYSRMCRREPQFCDLIEGRSRLHIPGILPLPSTRDGRVILNQTALILFERVNTEVNRRIEPADDINGDDWQVIDMASNSARGDCEDFVLSKRFALIAYGFPAQSLLIGVVRGRSYAYHAVLILRTDHGDLVLDNVTDQILPWRETGYEWVMRQSQGNPAQWVRIAPEPEEEPIDPTLFVPAMADPQR